MSIKTVITDTTKKSLIATGSVVAVNVATSFILPVVGFAQGGVVAGSVAAGIQSSIGVVAAGSTFAGCQSLGALGLGLLGTAVLPIALGTGAIVGGVVLYKKFKG